VITLGFLTFSTFGQQSSPDLILLNGKVFTSNASHPYVEAIAIRGERILAVGTSKEIVPLAGKDTKRIDLEGRTVIPGINDAHVHLGAGPENYDLPLQGDNPKWQEIKDALSLAVTKVPKGTWITGGFNTYVLEDPQATKRPLDGLAPDHPVLLWLWGGHASLLNSPALKKLGVREDEPDPEGGRYVRNPSDRKPTGMAYEFATMQLNRRYSALASEQEAVKQLLDELGHMARLGNSCARNLVWPHRWARPSDGGWTRPTGTPCASGHSQRHKVGS
jgi:predicted amidohydrolase YtcJ